MTVVEKEQEEPRAPRLPVQQLGILSICRIAEPVALTSVNPYLPEMIESFGVAEDDVAKWVGITSAAFSLTQCLTSFSWQNLSDRVGRKYAVLTALTSAMLSTLFFGFSQNLPWAIVARCFSGAANGNAGIVRTMVAELVPQRALQPRAFSIMPLVWCVGSVFGPVLGGALAMPASNFPALFGHNWFLKRFPFALPNIIAAIIFSGGVLVGFLFLKETLETKKYRKDPGLILGKYITAPFTKRPKSSWMDDAHSDSANHKLAGLRGPPPRASYREVFTFQSTMNLVAYTFVSLHAVAFDQLVAVFLYLPKQDHSLANANVKLPFRFAGGFGLNSGQIGLLFTIFGVVTMLIQFLIFPPIAQRYGVLRCFQACAFAFPFAYVITPFCVLLPTSASRQAAIFMVMMFKGFAGVFAYPCSTVLLTNSARTIPILGTLNALATSVSALAKAIGPGVAGTILTRSIESGYIVTVWWCLAIVAIPGYFSTLWLVEQDGPSADNTSGSVAMNASQEEDGIEEEELALLTAVDAADHFKNTPDISPPHTPNGRIVSAGDEEEAVNLMDMSGDNSTTAAEADHATTGAEFLLDRFVNTQAPLAGGLIERRASPVSNLRPPLSRQNSAASTARSASMDRGLRIRERRASMDRGLRSTRERHATMKSPAPMGGHGVIEDDED